MGLSVCMITKNEAAQLEKCLQALKAYPVEIVVVDTGSTDHTMEIIKKYADVYGEFEWCDDFSRARNYSVTLAGNDLILIVDTDEIIQPFDYDSIIAGWEDNPKKAGRIEQINIWARDGEGQTETVRVTRLFDRRYYHFAGRIHEQVIPLCSGNACLENVPIAVLHSGYGGDETARVKKADRNIKLLLRDLEENGEDTYTLYQLGKSYYMQQDYNNAAYYFEKALEFDINPKLEYIQDMIVAYGYTLLNLKEYEHAMFLESICDEFGNSADFTFLLGLVYMNNQRYEEAIRAFERAVTFQSCKVQGCNSYKAYYNAGVICECLGRKEEALAYYRRCKTYEPAKKGLLRMGEN